MVKVKFTPLTGVVDALIDVAVQVVFITRIQKEIIGRIDKIFNSPACSPILVGLLVLEEIGFDLDSERMRRVNRRIPTTPFPSP